MKISRACLGQKSDKLSYLNAVQGEALKPNIVQLICSEQGETRNKRASTAVGKEDPFRGPKEAIFPTEEE